MMMLVLSMRCYCDNHNKGNFKFCYKLFKIFGQFIKSIDWTYMYIYGCLSRDKQVYNCSKNKIKDCL